MDQQLLNSVDEQYLEKKYIMEAVSKDEAGISFLKWLVRLTGFNRPIMSLEDASRRDVWLTIRPFVPVDKLSLIEHQEIRDEQQKANAMIEAMFAHGNEIQEVINE